ncbi:hypothetical protein ASPZODRAFT_133130 [Penicilliopsis zonata CBS 506.65]|uniref:Probable beta-glucosidase btgE n=1 Tax=Penicilliopsis zonata CBS 506.65 TaxID=1073090 RepID=A0A1L9SGG1_9EURO|nr:hypothetical protein ASPZODRAFT_133130 [Penicilliopsis zonata CBS 506.65]OJJ46134.1 hypothetical protein ASPZODRAFT_133130 [Penicilliopsis zonata CBS 506.65]
MKGTIFAVASALMGSALADGHMRRHGHDVFHQRRDLTDDETCDCTTKVITYWGEPTLVPIANTVTSQTTTTIHSTSYTTVTVVVTPSSTPAGVGAVGISSSSAPAAVLPTGSVVTFSSTGVYTIPASTVTVTSETTVAALTTAAVTSGTNTVGGVTTVVETETVITCPYATTTSTGTTVTEILAYTTYTCPVAGTYTIAPVTTYVETETQVVIPTPATIAPGTYTQPEQTVTVPVTDYIYYCPFATSSSSSSSASSTSSTVAPAVATTTTSAASVPAVTDVAVSVASTVVAATTSTSSSVSSSSSSAAVASSTASTGTSDDTGTSAYGMTYDPYTDAGDCKTQDSITSDIAAIAKKGFSHVRIYSPDCSGLDYIGSACKTYGLTLILGVYFESSDTTSAQEQVDEIISWAQWGLVDLIVVGNEAVMDGYLTASELASFISSAKSSFTSAGYTGQVTTSEPVDIWQEDGTTLCSVVDVVGANVHPFFNADTTAEQAGSFVASEMAILDDICSGLSVFNLETGWPTQGDSNGDAVPGYAEQITAIEGIVTAAGDKSVFLSYANDLWKSPGEFDVEQYWGCIDVF